MRAHLCESPCPWGDDVLVIDDMRIFDFPAVYARTADEAEALIHSRKWREVWFDHDLGLDIGCDTTRELVSKLEELAFNGSPVSIEHVYVHSANPAGRAWLKAALDRWYDVEMVTATNFLAAGSPVLYWQGEIPR